ncbi:gluconate 2-dehydrogenase subunit 3 family protein, partial [Caballeronia arvi]|uniref:gluconate 2-dehydrogenase subunit 3 family protein n=1 Tax=Caballeronia arvi TaxID=1777135 RepID=UPI000A4219F8
MTLPPKTRYPGYDVLQKRDSVSWDDATRAVIDERMAVPATPVFCDAVQWRALSALCDCLMPQNAASADRPMIPVAALVDAKIASNHGDGYRDARLPPLQQAWRTGLAALDA